MNRRYAIYRFGLLVVIGSLVIASGAMAISWDAFSDAHLTGITLDKPLQVNVLDYTLTIGADPTITLDSHTYKVNWIQSFYVVSGKANGAFTATNGPNNTGWSWDSKTSGGGEISGWTGQGNDRILPGQSKTFHFSSFDPNRTPVVTGFHVSYQDGHDSITGWWKDNLATVPEPSTFASVGFGAVGLYFFKRRKKARQ